MGSTTAHRIAGLKKEFGQAYDNFFMLDENISDLILRDLAAVFGSSSHVRLEGLQGPGSSDESDIWPYMLQRRTKALLTADNDFKPISIRHRGRLIDAFGSVAGSSVHAPVVIHIVKNISRLETMELLVAYQDEIRRTVTDNDCAYASLSEGGLVKCEPDAGLVARNLKIIYPHRHSFLPPSAGPAR